jgi:photoactive yellow protein
MEFTAKHIQEWLVHSDGKSLDALPFSVIGFDHNNDVCRYNVHESTQSLLPPSSVFGRNLFTDITTRINNALVAKRFDDAHEKKVALDAVLDYVIAFKSCAGPTVMRMLHSPDSPMQYLLIKRLGEIR